MSSDHPIVARLQWILKERQTNATELSKKARFSPAYVNQIINRRHSGELKWEAAEKLARAANVRTEWLLDGSEPREPFVEAAYRTIGDAVLVARERALPKSFRQFRILAEAEGADSVILDALAAGIPDGEDDPGLEHWEREYFRLREHRAALKEKLSKLREPTKSDLPKS